MLFRSPPLSNVRRDAAPDVRLTFFDELRRCVPVKIVAGVRAAVAVAAATWWFGRQGLIRTYPRHMGLSLNIRSAR